MTLNKQTLEQIRQLSKDEESFHKLVTLYEQNQAQSAGRSFNTNGDHGVVAYHAHLLEIVGDAVISLDSNFNIVSWNKAAESMYGWREDEVMGRLLSDIVPTEYPGGAIQDTLTQLYQDGLFEDDFIHQRRDGTKFDIHTVTSLIRGDAGEITGYVAINRDISIRKETERKLEESEQFLRAIFEGTQTAIFVISVTDEGEFRFVAINPAYEHVSGFTASVMVNKTPDELPGVGPEITAQIRENYQKCLETRQPMTYEDKIKLNGEDSWWLTQLTPIITPDGNIHTIVGTGLNITELRLAEKALRENELFLRTIFESEQVYILVVDVLEDGDFIFTGLSPGFAQSTGLIPESILGKRVEEVATWPPELQTHLKGQYNRCLIEGVPITFEVPGETRWWLTHLSPLRDSAGRIFRLIGSSMEITERKRMEKASEELVRLEMELEKERELRSFQTRVMTMITHDFKTPLATIQTSTDLLKRYAERFTGEAILNRLDRIQAQVRVLDELVDETIALRRSEIYDYIPQPEIIDLTSFLKMTINDVVDYTENSNPIDARFNGNSTGIFDATLLRQIAINLIMNAVKYSPHNTPIQVRCTCQTDRLELIVEDSGIGIPEEEQEHIFKLFYRAGNAVNLQGNGMGLAIVKQAVEWHGGSIVMTSQLNQGTRFVVTLPQLEEPTRIE